MAELPAKHTMANDVLPCDKDQIQVSLNITILSQCEKGAFDTSLLYILLAAKYSGTCRTSSKILGSAHTSISLHDDPPPYVNGPLVFLLYLWPFPACPCIHPSRIHIYVVPSTFLLCHGQSPVGLVVVFILFFFISRFRILTKHLTIVAIQDKNF